jgi:hypothetical protein
MAMAMRKVDTADRNTSSYREKGSGWLRAVMDTLLPGLATLAVVL